MSPTLPTFDQLHAAGKTEVQSRNASLTDWNQGSVLDAVIGGGAVIADEVLRIVLGRFAAQFVDTATGADLDALAADRFRLTRKAAAASVGTLTFAQSVSAADAVTVPAETVCRATVNGRSISFTVVSDVVVPALGGEAFGLARCADTGAAGNVDVDTITTVVDTIVGAVDLTVTNEERFAGGMAEELDPAFRDRIRRFFSTQRRGTLAALEAGALNVAGVAFVTVSEAYVAPEDGGYVAVYVGDPDGRGNTALADAVEEELENWRAAGVEVRVEAAEREEIPLELTITVRRGTDQSTVATLIRAAILAYTDNIGPGATLYLSQITAAAHAASTSILGVGIDDPTVDTVPSNPYKAMRVLSTQIALTFVEA